MANPNEKKAVHAYLSPEAWEGWDNLASNGGGNVTAVLEHIGLELYDELESGEVSDRSKAWIKGAQKVANERRRRGGSRK